MNKFIEVFRNSHKSCEQKQTTTRRMTLIHELDNDRDRYDRQVRTIGRDAMQKILQSKTLIVGMGGLGAEIGMFIVAGQLGTMK